MARQFLTGLDLNQNELLNARIQNLAIAPETPVSGQIYYNTSDNTLRYYTGSAWLTLAQGGSVEQAIAAVVDALTTDDIEEGATNKYYSTTTAKTDAAALLTSATLTNITITGNGAGLVITAENGIADSTTDDLTEGTTNLYFTNSRALSATASAYDAAGAAASAQSAAESYASGLAVNYDAAGTAASAQAAAEAYALGLGANYDAVGSAATVQGNLDTHALDTATHGVTGHIVGTENAQSLTNKTLGTGTVLSADVDADGHTITDLGTPLVASDAATKGYVDTEIADHADNTTGVHGVTGNLVGTTDIQSLTNKTLGASVSLSADLDADGSTIINLPLPTAPGDAASKAYVDSVAEGLHIHASVAAATTVNIDLGASVLAVDGVTIGDGDRVLVRAQTNGAQNGIYVSNGTTLSRAADFDTAGEIQGGDFVFVTGGTTFSNAGFVQTELVTTVGTDPIAWVQFSGAGTFAAGEGLTLDGNEFNVVGTADRISVGVDSVDIASTYVGQTSITTVGTITDGTWNGGTIAIANGGTGATTAADARTNLGATTKFTLENPELLQTGGAIEWVITHNMGIRTVLVQLFTLDDFDQVEVDVERTNTNQVTLRWVSPTDVAINSYQVVIIG